MSREYMLGPGRKLTLCRVPSDFRYKLLRTTGGDPDMHTTANAYRYSPGPGRMFRLHRITVHIEDGKMDVADFGGITGQLTNGCLLKVHAADDTVLLDFLNGMPIKKNGDWALLAGVDSRVSTGVGNDELAVRFTVAEAGDQMCIVDDEYIEFTTQDDLSALVAFHVKVQGLEFDIIPF